MKNLLGRAGKIGRFFLKSETGSKIVKGLKDYRQFKYNKTKLTMIVFGFVVLVSAIGFLTGKITFDEFIDAVNTIQIQKQK